MRIALMGTKYSPPHIRGGEDAVIHALKKELERRGHHVHVYVAGWRHFRQIDLASSEPNIIRLKVPYIRYLYHFFYAWQFKRILQNTHYDLFLNTHSHFGFRLGHSPHLVVVATTSKGEAHFMRINSPVKAVEWLVRSTLAYWVEKDIFKRCDHVIAVSPHIRDEILQHYGTRPDKITVVGNGVDVARFCPVEQSDVGAVPVIFTACRLVLRKNVALLIRAAAMLKERGVGFAMKIAGEGDQADHLHKLAYRLGVAQDIRFLGRIDSGRMLQEYRHCDLFALPSRYEGMPIALLESQACAVPAVVAPFVGADDIIKQGENGFILREDSPEELADCLARLLKDREMRRRMGCKARELMVTHFSWKGIVDRYLALIALSSPVNRES